MKYFTNLQSAIGPLVIVEGVDGIGYDAHVTIEDGEKLRHGKVLEINGDKAIVQLFESSQGLDLSNAKACFSARGLTVSVSPEILGRVFNGIGSPTDGGSPLLGAKAVDINGTPINPVSRQYPRHFIQTGISAIDGLNTLVRGQKLPIFSMSGLPHSELASQIARQATVRGDDEKFAIVFAGIGISHDEAEFFKSSFTRDGSLTRSVMFLNLASDPAVERIATPRMAITTAEYLAFELGYHVLVIMTDMTNYAEALREISSARKEVPGRRGYPCYMYTDFASLYERAGCIQGRTGTVTQIPILTAPEDDLTHPIPDLTGYITEGQIILSREIFGKGINPPIDVLPSLSRLKDKADVAKIISKSGESNGFQYANLPWQSVMNQLFSAYAKGKDAKELAQILGEEALSELDKLYSYFATEFENRYVNQGFNTNRSIEDTLNLGWQLLHILPRAELIRIKENLLDEYYTESSKK